MLDKLRQAVMELSEQVLQMREGLQSLRQAVQLILAPHGEGPSPRASGEGPCPASGSSGLLQPLCVDTGTSSYCLQPPAGSVLSGTRPHPRPGPPPLVAPWPWGPPASQSSPWPQATAFWTSTSDSEPPGSGELCPEPSTPGPPPPEEGARTGPPEPMNQAEAASTGEPPPGAGGLALPWEPQSLEMVLIGCHGSGTVQWTQEEGTGV